jgi:hypothetical protein
MPDVKQYKAPTDTLIVIAAGLGCAVAAIVVDAVWSFGTYYYPIFGSVAPYYLLSAAENVVVAAVAGSVALFTRPKTWAVPALAVVGSLVAVLVGDLLAAVVAFPLKHYGTSLQGVTVYLSGIAHNTVIVVLLLLAPVTAAAVTVPRVRSVRARERRQQQGPWPAAQPGYGAQAGTMPQVPGQPWPGGPGPT